MMEQKNMEKYVVYKTMKENLAKALRNGFYYQAIFIEYAIIEDRCASVLKHACINYLDKNGFEIKLSKKINKLRGNPAFTNAYVRKRITLELLDELEAWKKERDQLIHKLATIPYNNDSIREIAEKGNELVKQLDNKVRSVNNYYDKH